MPTLNRFPLLGLWAKEAARRLGYRRDEAESLGHAYAVLYAIRAQRVRRPAGEKEEAPAEQKEAPRGELLPFGGDKLEITRDAEGHVRGQVGGEKPQTAASYQSAVKGKFPPGYYETLEQCFRRVLEALPPSEVNTRLLYNLYDEWKKSCGKGRLVDLDRLVKWCVERAGQPSASAPVARPGKKTRSSPKR